MRILYLNFDRGIPTLGDKGGSVHVRSVVTAMARLGHEVTVLSTRLGAGNAPPPGRMIELPIGVDTDMLQREARTLGLDPEAALGPAVRRELELLAHDRALPARIAAVLRDAPAPDLIYERHALFHRTGAALARRLRVPRILEVNSPLTEEAARHRGLVLRDLAAAREAASWRAATLNVAVSQAMRHRLEAAGVTARQILVAPNGVDTSAFAHDPVVAAMMRRKLGLGEVPLIGFVDSFKAWHGIDLLIDSFAALHRQRPGARLLAVGEGPMQQAARERIAALGLTDAVIFAGAVPHAAVPAYLASMDFTVAPYAAQPGFYFSPLKVVESLAAGRPVVAPGIGQITALVDDGITGLLYPPDDHVGFLAAMHRLLSEPGLCGRLGQQASQHAHRVWNWTGIVERILDDPALRPTEAAA